MTLGYIEQVMSPAVFQVKLRKKRGNITLHAMVEIVAITRASAERAALQMYFRKMKGWEVTSSKKLG